MTSVSAEHCHFVYFITTTSTIFLIFYIAMVDVVAEWLCMAAVCIGSDEDNG